jgi:GH43 family beta-xylosidase
MIKRFSLILFVVVLMAVAVACNSGEPVQTTADNSTTTTAPTTTAPANGDVVIAENGATEYKIVISATADDKLKGYANDFAELLKTKTGATAEITDDSKEATVKEILIGETSREENAKITELLGDKDYVIALVGEKLVLFAKNSTSYSYLLSALESVIMSEGSFTLEKDYAFASNKDLFILSDLPVTKNQEITFSVKLGDKKALPGIFIGSENANALYGHRGYGFTISAKSVLSYNQRDKRYDVYEKAITLDADKWYDVTVRYAGQYLVITVANDPEGIEPWPEFEVQVGNLGSCKLFLTEESGKGLHIKDLAVKDLVIDDNKTYKNSLFDGADPDIIYHDGTYYMYVTSTGYDVYSSKDLANWKYEGQSLPNPGWEGEYANFWAPDVEYINGTFYMAVSFGEDGLGIATSKSPLGPFVCQGDAPLLKKTIDGHIFVDDNGKVYLYYTSWQNRNGAGRTYGIYGVEMSSDLVNPKWETEKLIFKPTQPWENTQNRGGVVEAPFMLKHNGIYYLVYSGSHFEADYAVGFATSSSPLGSFVKYKNNPVLIGTANVSGTGHCSIINAPDGTMVMVYHTHATTNKIAPRKICIDPVRFVPGENGMDILEVKGPTVTSQEASWLK